MFPALVVFVWEKELELYVLPTINVLMASSATLTPEFALKTLDWYLHSTVFAEHFQG